MSKIAPCIALFPGTFDPMTFGHLDLIRRGQLLFDQLVVGIGHNPEKTELFTPDERVQMIREVLLDSKLDVSVESYEGLTFDFARQINASVILRGIRNVSDIQFEFQLALANKAVAGLETVFIMCAEEYGFTSSSLIKQIAAGGGVDQLAHLLPPLVIHAMREKIRNHSHLFSHHTDQAMKE